MKAHLGSDKNGAETAEAAGYIQIFKGARQKLQDGLPRSLRSLAMTFKTSPQALSRLRHCRHMPHDRRCALPPTSLPAHALRPPMRAPAYVIASGAKQSRRPAQRMFRRSPPHLVKYAPERTKKTITMKDAPNLVWVDVEMCAL